MSAQRRLPVYILLDSSGSMKGEPIESVKTGVRAMVDTLRQDPHALESVHLSIITFDRDVTVVTPLTALIDLQVPDLKTPDSGPTHTGAALKSLCARVDSEVRKKSDSGHADWKPILFLMTDGKPSDISDYKAIVPEVQKRDFAMIIACAAGPKASNPDLMAALQLLTDRVFTLETMDGSSFESLFKWVSSSIEANTTSVGVSSEAMIPPPPPEVNSVL